MFYPEKQVLPVLCPTYFLIKQRNNGFASEDQSCQDRKATQRYVYMHARQKELQMIRQHTYKLLKLFIK